MSYWVKFLQESDLSIENEILMKYSAILTERFSTIEELLSIDEKELENIGISNQLDCENIIKQARIIDEKENLPLIRQCAASNSLLDNWHRNTQSTPLNPKSKCTVSPALLSRISFNDHSIHEDPINIPKKCHFEYIIETPSRVLTVTTPSCSKRTPPASVPGMRILKSISDTISVQKRIVNGHDRLKRLALTKSLFKRQTSLITKKVSSFKNKLFLNPFNKIKPKSERLTVDHIQVIQSDISIEKSLQQIQYLNLNKDHENSKYSVQTLPNRRFKLGAPTTFLTRSIANHAHNE